VKSTNREKKVKENNKTFDIVLKNGTIVNGTGTPGYKADVAITGNTIQKIGCINTEHAKVVVDVSGLVVAPGFIDIHAHSDLTLLIDPRARNVLKQGVTTQLLGNCGYSGGPIAEGRKELYKDYMIGYRPDLEIDWAPFGDYLNRLAGRGVGINVASLVGHGTIRLAVMGFDARKSTRQEMSKMKELVEEAMQHGAFGISSGLMYPPGSYADTEELIQLCKVVAAYGGFYDTHIRGEGVTFLNAVIEAIQTARSASLPLHLCHHHCKFPGFGKNKASLMIIDEARESGLDVTVDLHTYMMGATVLSSFLPQWVFEGTRDDFVRRLNDKKTRQKIKEDMSRNIINPMVELVKAGYADKVVIENAPSNPSIVNCNFEDIARERKKEPFDVVMDILLSEVSNLSSVMVRAWIYGKEDLYTVLTHHTSMIASDGIAGATDGPLSNLRFHPRSYGTFPRLFRKFVREEKVLTIEEAVRKVTSSPAQLLRLKDRGLILEGMKADITVFNPFTITDKATYDNPNQYAQGVEHVLVNGTFVIKKGNFTDELPGEVLRRQT